MLNQYGSSSVEKEPSDGSLGASNITINTMYKKGVKSFLQFIKEIIPKPAALTFCADSVFHNKTALNKFDYLIKLGA